MEFSRRHIYVATVYNMLFFNKNFFFCLFAAYDKLVRFVFKTDVVSLILIFFYSPESVICASQNIMKFIRMECNIIFKIERRLMASK